MAGTLYSASEPGASSTPPGPKSSWDHSIPGSRQFLLASGNQAAVTPSGYLLFVRNGTLVAQRLDLSRFQFVGEPSVVAENLTVNLDRISNAGNPPPGARRRGETGATRYRAPRCILRLWKWCTCISFRPPQKSQLVWYSRDGKRLGTAGEPREYNQLFLSPDKRLAAVSIRNDKKDRTHWNIWLLQLDTNVLSLLTFGDGLDADPVWSPDSSRIVYGAYKAEEGEKIDLMEFTLGERSQDCSIRMAGRTNPRPGRRTGGSSLQTRRTDNL